MTFSISDPEGPYSYSEASESASSSDTETPHDDHSEAPNPESSTLPQDESPFSQDGVIEQAQKERTKALNMAKKSMHKAKRCAKEAQKPTLEVLLQP